MPWSRYKFLDLIDRPDGSKRIMARHASKGIRYLQPTREVLATFFPGADLEQLERML